MTHQATQLQQEAEHIKKEIEQLTQQVSDIEDEGNLDSQRLHAEIRALSSEHQALLERICTYCEGEGEVLDKSRINSTTIDEPYKVCPMCGGRGVL